VQGNVPAGFGAVTDLYFRDDGTEGFIHQLSNNLTRLGITGAGVSRLDQEPDLLKAASLKLEGGFLYDREGTIVDADTLTVDGQCDADPTPGALPRTLLVEPSSLEDVVYYLDAAPDTILSTCDETGATDTVRRPIPDFGETASFPRAIEEIGLDRIAYATSDKLVILTPSSLRP
jgi:hypothetical protein